MSLLRATLLLRVLYLFLAFVLGAVWVEAEIVSRPGLAQHPGVGPTCCQALVRRDVVDYKMDLEAKKCQIRNVQLIQIGSRKSIRSDEDLNQIAIGNVDANVGRGDTDVGEIDVSDPFKHDSDIQHTGHQSFFEQDVSVIEARQVEHTQAGFRNNESNPNLGNRTQIVLVEPALTERADPKDWLFHVQTPACGSNVLFDNPQDSRISHIFLPCLFIFCVGALVKSVKHHELDIVDGASQRSERMYHLDFARIVAVMCVVFEHSGGEGYTHRNVGFGLWWALPFLFLTSGMASMMSKSSTSLYIMRLAMIFIMGVAANWIADVITHRDWQGNFADTIFQMFFVVMLIVMVLLTKPLRLALHVTKYKPYGTLQVVMMACMIFWGALTFVGFWYFTRAVSMSSFQPGTSFGEFYKPLMAHLPLFLIEFSGTFFLCFFASLLRPNRNADVVGWVLLIWIYLPQLVVPWHQNAFCRFLSLYIFAMVTFMWPLAGGECLAKGVRAYWPFLLMLFCLLAMPDMEGRCDMFPPGTLLERCRHLAGECILTVCFISGAFATSDPYGVTVWMGDWSLFAYCFHVALFRLFGSPYGAALTFAFIPVFYGIHIIFKKPHAEAILEQQPSTSAHGESGQKSSRNDIAERLATNEMYFVDYDKKINFS